jgi:hypothetical protein
VGLLCMTRPSELSVDLARFLKLDSTIGTPSAADNKPTIKRCRLFSHLVDSCSFPRGTLAKRWIKSASGEVGAVESGTKAPGTAQTPSDQAEGALYPFKFSRLREGDKDPTLNKVVDYLIDSDDDFIVYLDDAHYVEWNMNDNNMLGCETGPYLNMVGGLEAVDVSYLTDDHVKLYRRMVAEGVARLFQKNLEAARAAFDLAEKWVTARNTEIARRWYLLGSGCAALVSAFAVAILGFWGDTLRGDFGPGVYNILMGTSVGGLGAWFSVIQRSRKTELDVAAGPMLHWLEGAFRIMVGTLGSMLIALAIRAGLIGQVKQLSTMMVICMVAGASERLVPSFIEQIESRTAGRDSKSPQ